MRLSGHDLLCLSSVDWDRPEESNRPPLMARLAEMNRVLFVNAPWVPWEGLAEARSRARWAAWWSRRLQRMAHNLYVGIPPFATGLRHLDDWRLERSLRKACSRLGFQAPILWVDPAHASAMTLMQRLPACLKIAHLTHERPLPSEAEREVLACADLAFVPSREQQRVLAPQVPALWMPDGIDFERFNRAVYGETPEPRELAGCPRPRVVSFEALDQDFDWGFWTFLAASRPDWTYVSVGEAEAHVLERFRHEAPPNMRFLGARSVSEWTGILKACEAVAMPHPHGASSLRLYEAYAAGKPVVTRDGRELDDLVLRAASPRAFIEALDEAVRPAPRGTYERIRRAQEHTWEASCRAMEGAVLDALARRAQPNSIPLHVERIVRQAL